MGRSSLTHLAIVLTLCLAQSLAHSVEPGYRSCELFGSTHFRSFESSPTTYTPIETCLQSGSRVLVHNQWVKVVLHSYLNETTFTKGVEWRSTKIYVEFFGDLAGVPIALVSSDILLCECTLNCAIDQHLRHIGVDGVINVVFKRDAVLGNVLYLEYPRAGISMYIRKVRTGFNYGIRMPEQWSVSSQGMCQTGCPIKTDLESTCFDMVRGRQVCDAAFTGLSVTDDRYLSCIHDIFLWRDVRVSVDHRLALLDYSLIREYSTIDMRYSSLTTTDYSPIMTYQSIVDGSQCAELLFHRVDTTIMHEETLGHAQPLVASIVPLPTLKSEVPVSYSQPLSVVEPTTRKLIVELPHTGYGDVKHEETVVEGTERPDLMKFCVEHRTKSGMYYLMFPQVKSQYIQCDETNRAFLRSCPVGTVFTERMICETVQVMHSTGYETVQTPVVSQDSFRILKVQQDMTVVPTIPVVTTPEAVESIEFRKECETRRLSQKGVFFFPTPDNHHTYIQCDESNRAFIRTCPVGTVFTENLACEKMGEVMKVEKPVVQLDTVVPVSSYGATVQHEEVKAIKVVEIIPVEAPEYNALCVSQRLSKVGLFYLSFPSNRSMFIQCDESNRAFLKTCPVGTMFTEILTCEKVGEVRPVMTTVPVVPLPVVQTSPSYGTVETPRPVVVETIPSYGGSVVETPKPVVVQPIQMDLTVSSTEAVESIEFKKDCESRRLTSKGLFYIAHPTSRTQYIQCDESNRAFVRTCAVGTVFTENLACEKVGEELPVHKTLVETVRPALDSVVVPELHRDFVPVTPVVVPVTEATVVESVEYHKECEMKRLTHKGVFFIPMPTTRSQYIQCDESNRAFVRTCPVGTVFTENLACERIGEEVRSVVIEQLKPIVTVVQDVKTPVVEVVPVIPTYSGVQKDIVVTEKVVDIPHTEVPVVSTIPKVDMPIVTPVVTPVVSPVVAPVVTPVVGTVDTTVVESVEYHKECEMKRLTHMGVFFIPMPTSRTQYIQCDEMNRAFVRTCPTGTVFTENLACERLGMEIKTEQLVKPVVEQVLPVVPVVSQTTTTTGESNSYLNSIVTGIKKIFPSISRDETPRKQADILVEDRPLLLQRVPTVDGRIAADETSVPNPCSDEMRKQKRFFFIHPTNANKYIQCDESNRMTIKTCFKNTVFSEEKQTCI